MTSHGEGKPPEADHISGVETTGHEWDGIKELNNPLPRWWLFVFYATIAFAVVYWVLMPAWPGLPGADGATPGVLRRSDRAEVVTALGDLNTARAAKGAALKTATAEQILDDPGMRQYAMALGESIFGDNCATCHGAGGRGAKGYPVLADDVWLWGGKLSDIEQTIRHGVRSTDPATRTSEMPAYGRDGFLTSAQINDLVEYVTSLSQRTADVAAVQRAAPIFAKECAACHGPDGKGNRTKGAPNLTDADWLYGGDRDTIRETITNARYGVMPAWGGRFDDTTIKALAIYVHSLGGGE